MTTKLEQTHLSRVAALGCIACRHIGYEDSPAGIHHIRDGYGMGQRAPHHETLPLCGPHHQNGGPGVALHAGKQTWEDKFGTERELLHQVRVMLLEQHGEVLTGSGLVNDLEGI